MSCQPHAPCLLRAQRVGARLRALYTVALLPIPVDSAFRRVWDSVMAAFILLLGLVLPVQLAFTTSSTGAWLAADIVTDVMFVVDIAVNLRTTYWDTNANR